MELNERIREARKKCGLSQIDLADAMEVSRQTVSKWETGESAPEINKLPQLAKVLGVSLDWLFAEGASGDTSSEEPRTDRQAEPAYPDWLEHLPKSLVRLTKRYGWLFGLYLAVGGAAFVLIGVATRIIPRRMFFGNGFFELFPDANPMQGPLYGFNVISGIEIGVGALLILGGIVLAIVLKRWGNRKS